MKFIKFLAAYYNNGDYSEDLHRQTAVSAYVMPHYEALEKLQASKEWDVPLPCICLHGALL